jgi:hypothetical protein
MLFRAVSLSSLPLVAVLLASAPAAAQMISDPITVVGDRTQVEGVFQTNDVDYEGDGNDDFNVEEKILGINVATGVSPSVDLYGSLGLIIDADAEDFDNDGIGFAFGGGARSVVHKTQDLRVSAYGTLTLQKVDFEENDVEVKVTTTDLHGGAVCGFIVSPTVMPYAGLDLDLFSDGEAKVKAAGLSGDDDIERDDIVSLRIGAVFSLDTLVVRAEALVLGEDTLTIGVGKYL